MVYRARLARRCSLPTLLLMAVLCTAQQNSSKPSLKDQDSTQWTIGPIHRDEVLIDATVYDKHHQPVRELALKDFAVYEDGQRQTITAFGVEGSGYFFGYKPTNSISNGGIRIIKIKVHKRGMRVQSPRSYSADVSKSVQDRSRIPN